MNITAYLTRIQYNDPLVATTDVLFKLQKQHLLNVPFENLDIQNKIKIDLNTIYDKIVVRKRGGFCYELNYLFYQLLKESGFQVKMISGRVYQDGTFTPEFDHLALIVTIAKDNYLADVGFGEFSINPLKLTTEEIIDPRGIFRIEQRSEGFTVFKKNKNTDEFIPEYFFTDNERKIEEFQNRCLFHQTDPSSHFMKNRICSIATLSGRISLSGNKLKITEKGQVTEKLLDTETAAIEYLWQYFGIKL